MPEMTIKELARICGVAVSTVSRAMNDRSDVSAETRARIRAAAQEHGYVPNASARTLKISSMPTISVIVQGEVSSLLIEILELLENAFADAGYETSFSHITDARADAMIIQRIVKEGKFAGVVFLGRYGGGDRERSSRLSRQLADINVPMIFCTTPDYSGVSAQRSFVSVDDRAGAYALTRRLLDAGHRRIAFVSAGDARDREHAWALRLAGYTSALEAADIALDPALVAPAAPGVHLYTMEGGYRSTREWLATAPPDVTAIVALCDAVALGAVRALNDAGLAVPHDLSVVGFDGLDIATYHVPRLTTVAQPLPEIARATARVLLATIDDPGRPAEHVWVRGSIVEGESVVSPRLLEAPGARIA